MFMDIDVIIGVVVLAFIGLDIFTVIQSNKENKAKTGRFFPSWDSMSTLRKANTVGLIILFLAMMYWLYNYSILAPWYGRWYPRHYLYPMQHIRVSGFHFSFLTNGHSDNRSDLDRILQRYANIAMSAIAQPGMIRSTAMIAATCSSMKLRGRL